MRITTKLSWTLGFVFLGTAICLGIAIIAGIERHNAGVSEQHARRAERGAFDLSTLTSEFLVQPGVRVRKQWTSRHARFRADLDQWIGAQGLEGQALAEVAGRLATLGATFAQLSELSASRDDPQTSRVRRLLTVRLLSDLQAIVSTVEEISEQSKLNVERSELHLTVALLCLIAVLAGSFVFAGAMIGVDVVMPLLRLSRDVSQSAHEDLDKPVTSTVQNEVGELVREIERMRKRLRDLLAHEHHRSRKLAESEARFRALLGMAPIGFIIADQTGTIKLVNEELGRLFGYGADELIDRNVDILVPDQMRDRHVVQRHQYMSNPTTRQMAKTRDVMGLKRDGNAIAVDIALSTVTTADGQMVIAAVRDVTEQRATMRALRQRDEQLSAQAIELRQTVAELEQFAHVASHDLRSPLRGIKNLSTWIKDDAGDVLPPEAKENLAILKRRVDRMDRLLTDLLAYSRAGRMRHEVEVVDTGELVRGAFDLSGATGTLSLTFASEMPIVKTVRVPLQHVFVNLLTNAAKHHDRAAGTVSVSAEPISKGYRFIVRDDGPGIAEDDRARVFEMFRTLRRKDDVESTGMGLTMVQRYVELQGGRIWIESTESPDARGTAFCFDWPCATADEMPEQEPETASDRPALLTQRV